MLLIELDRDDELGALLIELEDEGSVELDELDKLFAVEELMTLDAEELELGAIITELDDDIDAMLELETALLFVKLLLITLLLIALLLIALLFATLLFATLLLVED